PVACPGGRLVGTLTKRLQVFLYAECNHEKLQHHTEHAERHQDEYRIDDDQRREAARHAAVVEPDAEEQQRPQDRPDRDEDVERLDDPRRDERGEAEVEQRADETAPGAGRLGGLARLLDLLPRKLPLLPPARLPLRLARRERL